MWQRWAQRSLLSLSNNLITLVDISISTDTSYTLGAAAGPTRNMHSLSGSEPISFAEAQDYCLTVCPTKEAQGFSQFTLVPDPLGR